MEKRIQAIEKKAREEIKAAQSPQELEELRVKYLGRKAEVNQLFAGIAQLKPQQRPVIGQKLNQLKQKLKQYLAQQSCVCSSQEQEKIDVTFPPQEVKFGRQHIISYVSQYICDIFEKIGFAIVEGDEIEDEHHNFNALNIPLEHPSRESFDTFYLHDTKHQRARLLRSHTSPSQIRVMEEVEPPLAVVSPGKVYRPDKVDASHSFMFHQIEGFCVDKEINFAHLKGVLLKFARDFFSDEVKLRFRPHFFPFTEPSAEVDISCVICGGQGCSVCSHKGWLEILGCGMIHPKTLAACNIDADKYQGFAFGMGVERIAMLKYGIDDIRLFFENDKRFLGQFYEV